MASGQVSVGLAISLAIAWGTILAVHTPWHTKPTIIWNFHVGLWTVEVEKSVGGFVMGAIAGGADKAKGGKSGSLKAVVDSMTVGTDTIRHFRDLFCALPMPEHCMPWDHLMMGSWTMLICGTLGVVLFLTGGGLYISYLNQKSGAASLRKWSIGCLVAAPTILLTGLVANTLLAMRFQTWLAEIPGMSMSAQQSTWTFTYILALVMVVLAWMPIAIMFCCGMYSEAETDRLAKEDAEYYQPGPPLPAPDGQQASQQDPYAQQQQQQQQDPYAQQQQQQTAPYDPTRNPRLDKYDKFPMDNVEYKS